MWGTIEIYYSLIDFTLQIIPQLDFICDAGAKYHTLIDDKGEPHTLALLQTVFSLRRLVFYGFKADKILSAAFENLLQGSLDFGRNVSAFFHLLTAHILTVIHPHSNGNY